MGSEYKRVRVRGNVTRPKAAPAPEPEPVDRRTFIDYDGTEYEIKWPHGRMSLSELFEQQAE